MMNYSFFKLSKLRSLEGLVGRGADWGVSWVFCN